MASIARSSYSNKILATLTFITRQEMLERSAGVIRRFVKFIRRPTLCLTRDTVLKTVFKTVVIFMHGFKSVHRSVRPDVELVWLRASSAMLRRM